MVFNNRSADGNNECDVRLTPIVDDNNDGINDRVYIPPLVAPLLAAPLLIVP